MNILGTQLIIELSCSTSLEKKLRAAMLESMAGKTVILEYTGGSDQLSAGRILTFRNSDQNGAGVDNGERGFFGKYNNIFANGQNAYCRETYDFNKGQGTVTLSLDVANTKAAANAVGSYPVQGHDENWNTIDLNDADEVVENCVSQDGGLEGYKVSLAFRFKDGFLEFDPEGTDFSDGLDSSDDSTYKKLLGYQRGCVKASGSSTCDTASLPGNSYTPLPEVCHQIDSADNNCEPGSIDPWK